MTAKKSFFIILRVVFVLFSLQFLSEAFYKWDGFSYYMRFMDFLPDLSLAFIFWTIIIVILVVALWAIIYLLFRVIPKSVIPARLEHIIFILFFIVMPLFMKRTFYSKFSISEFVGLERNTIIMIGSVLLVVTAWFVRKHSGKIVDKILYGLNNRITPLVWIFLFLFVLSMPLSFFEESFFENKHAESSGATNATRLAPDSIDRPNILVVIMDSLTARDMQLHGYNRQTTPFISEWTNDAIVFEKAYAASNYTTPATMSLLTGQRVWTHKIWYAAYNNPADNYEESLPHVLRNNGYDIYGFVQNPNANPAVLGLEKPFTVNYNSRSFVIPKWWYSTFKNLFFPHRPIANRWIFSNSFAASQIHQFAPEVKTTLKPPSLVYDRFIEDISRERQGKSGRPFFAYLHVMAPHYDYLPPKPYMGLYGDAEKFSSNSGQWGNFSFNKEYPPEKQKDVDILRKRYDEFILYSDNEFRLLLSRLEEVVDMSNTIIVFSSDHGESFSHGWLAHVGPHLYDTLVHVPLVIKIPPGIDSISDIASGSKIDVPVEHIDLAPTILELAGIPVPEWMEGRSLKPMIEGKSIEPYPVFSMYLQKNRSFGTPITKGTVAVRYRDYKLVYYLEDEKKLLFNLESDPDEKNNIFEKEQELGQRLLGLIQNNLDLANKRILESRKEGKNAS